ncbi:hypothetical protein B0H11DRAFT_1910335 [Mycena galericulata]|nr:hypothetical protein B0H11DRAFT_1910335 [Mycena galericulata]
MAPGAKSSKATRGSVQQQKKAAKRREAGRLYYARHPEAREKSRLRMAAKRRQWDPPKGAKRAGTAASDEEARASADPILEEEEEAAHAALRALSRKRQRFQVEAEAAHPEPMTLTEIDQCESPEASVHSVCDEEVATRQRLERQIRNLAADDAFSLSEQGSATSVCELARRRLELRENRRIWLASVVAKKDRELQEQREREMRWLINSGPSSEDLYVMRGSLGVRAWLRELDEAES